MPLSRITELQDILLENSIILVKDKNICTMDKSQLLGLPLESMGIEGGYVFTKLLRNVCTSIISLCK